jgi:hypothetical protein
MNDHKDLGDKLLSALTTIIAAPRAAHKDTGKKPLRILLAIFLVAGGVIFTVFIFQGLGDLRNLDRGTFTYGLAARGEAVLPLFQYFGLSEEPAGYVRKRGRVDSSGKLYPPTPDISDWMAKGGTSAAVAGPVMPGAPQAAKNSAANPARNTPVPQMAGGAAGLGAGGGGSQSSAGAPKSSGAGGQPVAGMSKSQAEGEVKISDAGKSMPASTPVPGKLMGALASVKGAMMNSMRSNSAAVARSEWNQAFGADAGKGGASMAYASGSGLMKLDGIKGGVEDLKLNNPGSLKVVSPPPPTKDTASESKDDFLKAMQGMGQGGGGGGSGKEDNGKQGAQNAKEATTATADQIDPRTGSPVGAVPEGVIDTAYKCAADGGTRCCPGQCNTPTGSAVDEKVRIAPNGDGSYTSTYEGTQTDNASGSTAKYMDGAKITPDGRVEPAGTQVSCNGGPMQSAPQDCPPPDCKIQATPENCKPQRNGGYH